MKKFDEYIIPINETAKDYDEMFVGIIRRQPVLIRCKDCKYYRDDVGVCIGFGDGHYVMEEGFCSKAERRNDERME